MGRWITVLLVIGALLGLGTYWLGPGVVPRARLELLALDAGGQFAADAQLQPDDSLDHDETRYPLILAVRNTGVRSATPDELRLSMPGWVTLVGPTGEPLYTSDVRDEPLREYRFRLTEETIEPGALPMVPAGLENVAITAFLPGFICRLRWDGVPEFTPMPAWEPARLATIDVFYSLGDRGGRETGVLRLRVDADRVGPIPTGAYEVGETTVRRPSVALPALGRLELDGTRDVTCGAPEQRIALEVVVWRTGPEARGRLYVVLRERRPRRLMFDLDGDGRIEREAWDGDNDGRVEAMRPASFRVPVFLLPRQRPIPPMTPGEPDSTRADSTRADSAMADTTLPRVDTTAKSPG